MTYIAFYFEDAVKWGFLITLPLLLLVFYANRRWRPLIKQWLAAGYSLVFIYCFIVFVHRMKVLFDLGKYLPPKTDSYNFYYSATNQPGTYIYPLFILLTLVLYLFKRLRLSFAWGVLALVAIHYETVYIAITSLYMDSLHSSWRVYYYTPFGLNIYLFSFIAFNLLVLVNYYGRMLYLKGTNKVLG